MSGEKALFVCQLSACSLRPLAVVLVAQAQGLADSETVTLGWGDKASALWF